MPNAFGPVYNPPIPTPWYLAPVTLAATANVGAAVLAANKTYLDSLWVPTPVVITSATIGHGSIHAGNLDMGMYDANGNLLGHTGVTAAAAGNQTINFTTPLLLAQGLYYQAIWVDNATDTYFVLTNEGPALDNFLIAVGTNTGGLASTFAGMGGATNPASGSIVPFLLHIQGTGF